MFTETVFPFPHPVIWLHIKFPIIHQHLSVANGLLFRKSPLRVCQNKLEYLFW
jgi:hypothetical protein